ncbi:nucleotidyltransferase [Candidatus Parcubacteria bacterium]|nr:nucleotidyltransferase [Candidatus Parcubacteria bacterium]
MTDKKLNNLFLKYIRKNITPFHKEWAIVSDKYNELICLLEDKNVFQSGSCARFTSIKPINDLDVVWVLSARVEKAINSEELNLEDILVDLANKLQKEYKNIGVAVNVKPQTHSVGIYFGESEREFSIDIVPALKTDQKNEYGDDTYSVPEILFFSKNKRVKIYQGQKEISWKKSDPKGYKEEIKRTHDDNNNLRKVIRFIKKWRWHCKNNYPDFPLKSFHLELIVKNIFLENPNINCLEGIKLFYNNLSDYLLEPCLPDRANSACYIDEYVKEIDRFDRNEIYELIDLAKKRIDQVQQSNRRNNVFDNIQLLLVAKDDNEQFINDSNHGYKFVDKGLILKINGKVSLGKRSKKDTVSNYYLKDNGNRVSIGKEIEFYISEEINHIPEDEEVQYLWKVKNRGEKIYNKKGIRESRGEITENHTLQNPEQTAYNGIHFVECYAVYSDKCVAYDRIYVHIDKQ